MEEINPLGAKKISRLLVEFSIPGLIGLLVNSTYNVVDRIFIGNSPDLGSLGLAGITICHPISIIFMSVAILFGAGGATLFSIKLGEGDKEEARLSLGNSFMMLVGISLVMLILGQIFLKPILTAFGASADVMPYALEYMRVIFLGVFFMVVSMGLTNFVRADGSPNVAMLSMLLGAGTNILLDPLFIYVFRMGMTGAALATIIGQFLSLCWVLYYFLGNRCKNRLELKYMKLKPKMVSRIAALGIPFASTLLVNSFLNVLINKSLLKYGGDIAVSGMGVLNSIQTMLLMPIGAIGQGAQPIISFNYGARKYDRVKSTLRLAILTTTAILAIAYLATRLFPAQLVSLFNREPDLVNFGTGAVGAWFLCLPLMGFQFISSHFFQYIGRYKVAMFLALTRQIIFFFPALMLLPRFIGIKGILYTEPIATFMSSLLTGIWLYFGLRSLDNDSTGLTPGNTLNSQQAVQG